MRVIAENIANAGSAAKTPDGEPYRRKIVTFENELNREIDARTVKVGKPALDRSPFALKYIPGHPAADEKGYVKMPNVNRLVESMDMREAQRSYEANLNLIQASRRMMAQTMAILRG